MASCRLYRTALRSSLAPTSQSRLFPAIRRASTCASPPPPTYAAYRKTLWLVPLLGGATLYFAPRPQSLLPNIFSSPTFIPCPCPTVEKSQNLIIASPSEANYTLTARIHAFLRRKIWEPLLTAKRFIYLFALFVPVLLSSPMLLVGKPRKKYRGDRWGAVWWYGFLVSRMEAAGPTFVKVSIATLAKSTDLQATIVSSVGGIPCGPVSVTLLRTSRSSALPGHSPLHRTY